MDGVVVWCWADFWPDPAALRWGSVVGGLQSDGLFLLHVDDDDASKWVLNSLRLSHVLFFICTIGSVGL